jgi:hypothetical protein
MNAKGKGLKSLIYAILLIIIYIFLLYDKKPIYGISVQDDKKKTTSNGRLAKG